MMKTDVYMSETVVFFTACQPKRSNAQGLYECFRAMMRVIGEDSDWENKLVSFRCSGDRVNLILGGLMEDNALDCCILVHYQ